MSEHFPETDYGEIRTIMEGNLDLSSGAFAVDLACSPSHFSTAGAPTTVACITSGDYGVTAPCTGTPVAPCRASTAAHVIARRS